MKALKKYLRRERRQYPRHPVCTEVEFCIWDTVTRTPRTDKARGCLTAVSIKGACLQTNQLQMGGHHLFMDNDARGRTVLMVEVPSSAGESPWRIQAQVISYDKYPGHRQYQFDVRLQFTNPSVVEIKNLEQLIKAQISAVREEEGA